ncbi:MAG: hypothetical protein JWQ83_306 [Lacunisphaera sp.]|nr:hypothetical protein [Lacunisphaera sp.]
MPPAPSFMKPLFTSALLLALAGARPLHAADTPQPTYPLIGIVQADPSTHGGKRDLAIGDSASASIAAAADSTRLLYSTDGAPLRAVLKARNDAGRKTPPILVYMGGFTTNGDDVIALERDFRTGIALTSVAKISADLDATATQCTLVDPVDGELAVKASTAAASDTKDPSKFCFWLRVDDEFMKVTAVDAATGRITVERAFGGTMAAAHAAGANVLSPVYLGNRNQLGAARHSNSWPGGPDYLRYAVDPRAPASAKFKGGIVARIMKAGYDGAWFDTFQPMPYNLCDALGRKVSYFWDFGSGKPYDFDSYLGAIQTYVRNVRATVHAATGQEPVLYANSATGSYARGLKKLFNQGDTHDLLDGYCFEDSYLKVQATREKGKANAAQAAFLPITGEKWVTNVTNHADAARSGLSGLCMAGPAGYLAAYINPTQDNYAQLIRFAYGSHLLTVTKERATAFGLPLLLTPQGAAPWPQIVYAPLGDPTQANNVAALKLADSPCYQRSFEHGMVVVNPAADGPPVTVAVPAGYVDAITQLAVTSLTLAPADAAVLLRTKN